MKDKYLPHILISLFVIMIMLMMIFVPKTEEFTPNLTDIYNKKIQEKHVSVSDQINTHYKELVNNNEYTNEVKFEIVCKKQVQVGEQFVVSYELSENGENFKSPNFKDFKLIGGPFTTSKKTTSTQYIDGKVQSVDVEINSYNFHLKAIKGGDFLIPQATVIVDGKEIISKSAIVNIKSTNDNECVEYKEIASYVDVLDSCPIPETWNSYTFHKSFSLSVPPTVELRTLDDKYQNFIHRTDDVIIFQQKDLSVMSEEAMAHYCRVMILYTKYEKGEYYKYYESDEIDYETREFLKELVLLEVSGNMLLEEPTYKWVNVEESNAIEVKWRRAGFMEGSVACSMYLFFNDEEMVKMVISYREQERDIWLPDFDNIVKTFKWKNLH